jgi:hypothetical protein
MSKRDGQPLPIDPAIDQSILVLLVENPPVTWPSEKLSSSTFNNCTFEAWVHFLEGALFNQSTNIQQLMFNLTKLEMIEEQLEGIKQSVLDKHRKHKTFRLRNATDSVARHPLIVTNVGWFSRYNPNSTHMEGSAWPTQQKSMHDFFVFLTKSPSLPNGWCGLVGMSNTHYKMSCNSNQERYSLLLCVTKSAIDLRCVLITHLGVTPTQVLSGLILLWVETSLRELVAHFGFTLPIPRTWATEPTEDGVGHNLHHIQAVLKSRLVDHNQLQVSATYKAQITLLASSQNIVDSCLLRPTFNLKKNNTDLSLLELWAELVKQPPPLEPSMVDQNGKEIQNMSTNKALVSIQDSLWDKGVNSKSEMMVGPQPQSNMGMANHASISTLGTLLNKTVKRNHELEVSLEEQIKLSKERGSLLINSQENSDQIEASNESLKEKQKTLESQIQTLKEAREGMDRFCFEQQEVAETKCGHLATSLNDLQEEQEALENKYKKLKESKDATERVLFELELGNKTSETILGQIFNKHWKEIETQTLLANDACISTLGTLVNKTVKRNRELEVSLEEQIQLSKDRGSLLINSQEKSDQIEASNESLKEKQKTLESQIQTLKEASEALDRQYLNLPKLQQLDTQNSQLEVSLHQQHGLLEETQSQLLLILEKNRCLSTSLENQEAIESEHIMLKVSLEATDSQLLEYQVQNQNLQSILQHQSVEHSKTKSQLSELTQLHDVFQLQLSEMQEHRAELQTTLDHQNSEHELKEKQFSELIAVYDSTLAENDAHQEFLQSQVTNEQNSLSDLKKKQFVLIQELSVAYKNNVQLRNDVELQSTLTCFEKLEIEKAGDCHQALQIQHLQFKSFLKTEKERNARVEECLLQQTGIATERQSQLLIAQEWSKNLATSLKKSEESNAVLLEKQFEITTSNDARAKTQALETHEYMKNMQHTLKLEFKQKWKEREAQIQMANVIGATRSETQHNKDAQKNIELMDNLKVQNDANKDIQTRLSLVHEENNILVSSLKSVQNNFEMFKIEYGKATVYNEERTETQLLIQKELLESLEKQWKDKVTQMEESLHHQTDIATGGHSKLLIEQELSKNLATSLKKSEEKYAVLQEKKIEITTSNDARANTQALETQEYMKNMQHTLEIEFEQKWKEREAQIKLANAICATRSETQHNIDVQKNIELMDNLKVQNDANKDIQTQLSSVHEEKKILVATLKSVQNNFQMFKIEHQKMTEDRGTMAESLESEHAKLIESSALLSQLQECNQSLDVAYQQQFDDKWKKQMSLMKSSNDDQISKAVSELNFRLKEATTLTRLSQVELGNSLQNCKDLQSSLLAETSSHGILKSGHQKLTEYTFVTEKNLLEQQESNMTLTRTLELLQKTHESTRDQCGYLKQSLNTLRLKQSVQHKQYVGFKKNHGSKVLGVEFSSVKLNLTHRMESIHQEDYGRNCVPNSEIPNQTGVVNSATYPANRKGHLGYHRISNVNSPIHPESSIAYSPLSKHVQPSPGAGSCPLAEKTSAPTPSNGTGQSQYKPPSPLTPSLSSAPAYCRIWKMAATFLSLKKKCCLYLGTLKDYDCPKPNNEAKFKQLQGVMAMGRTNHHDDVPALEIFLSNGLKLKGDEASGDQLEPTCNQILHVFRGCKKKEVQHYLLESFSFSITMAKFSRGIIIRRETIASVNFHVVDDRVYIGYLTVSNGQNGSPKNLLLSAERGSWQGFGLGTFLLNLLLGVCWTMSPKLVQAGLHLNCSDHKDTNTIKQLSKFYHCLGFDPARGTRSLLFQKSLFEDAYCKHFSKFAEDSHNYTLMLGAITDIVSSTQTDAATSVQVLTTGSGTVNSQSSPSGHIVSPSYPSTDISPSFLQPFNNQYTTPQATGNKVLLPAIKKKKTVFKKKGSLMKKKPRHPVKRIRQTNFKLNTTPTKSFNVT